MEGGGGIFGALRWWGHRWDGCGVPVAFVGGEGVQGGGDDVVGCPSRTMWRSVLKSFGRWAAGWTVMLGRARWWAFFPPSGACVRWSPGMCWCWCFGGGGPRARESTPWRGMACSPDLLGRMYTPGSPGTVPRYVLPVVDGARSGGVLVGAVPGRGSLHRGGGWRVPWTCWAGCICPGLPVRCPGTCCP